MKVKYLQSSIDTSAFISLDIVKFMMRMITNGSTIFKHHLFLTDYEQDYERDYEQDYEQDYERDFRKTFTRPLNEHGRTI